MRPQTCGNTAKAVKPPAYRMIYILIQQRHSCQYETSLRGDVYLKELIHPTAIIHPKAKLHPTVQVDAFSVIGARVSVGPETVIGARVLIEGPCEIGAQNHIFYGAAIGLESQALKCIEKPGWIKIGDNNQIREYVTISRAIGEGEATRIGNGNLLMANVHVGYNCVIEDFVIIPNYVILVSNVHIESRARFGGCVSVHQFVHIGRHAMVSGMSRIEEDVPPYMLVQGNPARVRTLNRVGLKRHGIADTDLQTLKRALRILYHSKLTFMEAWEKLETLGDNEHLQHLRRFLLMSVERKVSELDTLLATTSAIAALFPKLLFLIV